MSQNEVYCDEVKNVYKLQEIKNIYSIEKHVIFCLQFLLHEIHEIGVVIKQS